MNKTKTFGKKIRESKKVNIRPLSKLALTNKVQGVYGAEDRNVLEVHEDLSNGATQQFDDGVEFRKRSIERSTRNPNLYDDVNSIPFALSVVVPLYNESESIKHLYKEISLSLKDVSHEIVFVDDGSIDDTVNEVLKIKDKNLKLIRFTRNFGQTSAMAAGIEYAKGEYIATLDGDLQNDPRDILMMLDILKKEKVDLVVGRRKNRKDGMLLRKIPSKIANYLIRKATQVNISDYGCTLKVFKSDIAKNIELYGELHRFIPILASQYGAKIKETDVAHHPRKFGVSKYGLSRTIRVISDLILMLFFTKYRQKPMHFFGIIGQVLLSLSGVILLYLSVLKLLGNDIGGRPLFFITILFAITGVQFITTGFIAELLMRTYYAAEKKKPYNIACIYRNGELIKRSKR
jgi:glycosyltransferase involved in cell wall biosynthesis